MSVTVAAGCAWQAVAGGFVTIAAGANGVGSGAVTYSVAANTTSETRTELINIAGQSFTITQAAASASNCSATLAPTNASLGPGAATGSLAVTIPAGCAWTATSNASYITITSGTSGVGSGTVSYSVAANTTGSSRSGTVTIAQQTFTVSQTGVSCGATVVPTSATVAEAGGSGSVAVTIPAGCSWTATSESSWVTITGGASGVGPGTVTYSVAANTTSENRSESVNIAGQSFTITQAAASASNCSATLAPTNASLGPGAATGSLAVTIPAGCAWTATSNASYITITSGTSGVGSGTVSYSVAANTTGSSRSGTVTIAQQMFTVTQTGVFCGATLSPTSATVAEAGGSGSVAVTIPAGCSWTATSESSWVTITGGASGVGPGTVTYSVPANSTGGPRNGSLSIAQQRFTLTQSGPACSNSSLSPPTGASFTGAGGTGTVMVTIPAGCSWQAFAGNFVTITSGASGVGPGTVTYSVLPNTTGASRNQSITIAGNPFMISQSTDGAPNCGATLAPTSATVAEAGGSGSVAVTIPAGCSWAATSESSWITITGGASGVGPATVTYSVPANPTGSPRNGSLSIAQQRFTLTQSGPPCSNSSLSPPTGASFTGAGGTGTVMVTIPAGCSWQAFAGNFVTITSGANGVGPGTVTYSVLPNTTGASRNHSITIAGNPFMISQSTDGAPNCGATLAPTSATVAEAGGSGSVAVTIPAGCSWTATSESSWITITGGASGVGPGTVTYSVPANPTGSPRNGSLSIAQQRFTLTQSGPPCSNSSLSPPIGANFTGAGGTGTVTVTIPAGCGWQAFGGNFVTITSGANSVGPGTVTYSVLPNTTGAARNHSITIAGHSFMVSQAAN